MRILRKAKPGLLGMLREKLDEELGHSGTSGAADDSTRGAADGSTSGAAGRSMGCQPRPGHAEWRRGTHQVGPDTGHKERAHLKPRLEAVYGGRGGAEDR